MWIGRRPNPSNSEESASLVRIIENNAQTLRLSSSSALHYQFPIYKDMSGAIVSIKHMLISNRHGVIVFGASSVANREAKKELASQGQQLDVGVAQLLQRLFQNPSLRKSRLELKIPIQVGFFAPNLEGNTVSSRYLLKLLIS